MSQQNPNQPQDKQPQLKLTSTDRLPRRLRQQRAGPHERLGLLPRLRHDEPGQSAEELKIKNFQGIYLSPQQAKALLNVLGHNLAQYEQTFGSITLEPLPQPDGPVN